MGLLDEDDFKISMDDIKDMVSELFGEKVEKIDEGKAKEILRDSTEEFLNEGIKEISPQKLTQEEENILREFESSHSVKQPGIQQDGETGKIASSEDVKEGAAKRKEGAAVKPEELKQKIGIGTSEKTTAPGLIVNYSEKMSLINMFIQSQTTFSGLLCKLMRKNAVDTMFLKTLENCIEKHPDVLKKTNSNQHGRIRQDGTLEAARLAANLNAMYIPEGVKTRKFLESLHDIFGERLAAIELALGVETKNNVLLNLTAQSDRIFGKKGYTQKLKDIFSKEVVRA